VVSTLLAEVRELKKSSRTPTPSVCDDGGQNNNNYLSDDAEDSGGYTGLSCPFNNIGLSELENEVINV